MSKILLRNSLLRIILKFNKNQSTLQQQQQQYLHSAGSFSVMMQEQKQEMKSGGHCRGGGVGPGTRIRRDPIYDFNRCWVTPFEPPAATRGSKLQRQPSSSSSYTLLSYNILAQDLLIEHLQLYRNINHFLLSWDKRITNIQQEINKLAPDIVCLQEMQFNHLQQLVKRISCGKRLEYVFKKKTGFRTDGCAIIYDSDKFSLIEDCNVEYYNEGIPRLDRENIAVLAKFRLKNEPRKEFVVSTTHLLYNPKREDVRSAQVGKLLEALAEFATLKKWPQEQLPVLLTGDFNFESNSKSYGILTSSFDDEDKQLKDDEMLSNSRYPPNENKDIKMKSLDFGPLTSSTFQDRWLTVDYILYSVGKNQKYNINVGQLYKLPSTSDCERVGPIPNRYLGSDHYSLGIKFSVN